MNKEMRDLPSPQGLYDPSYEHDACGIGIVANIKGKKSYGIIDDAASARVDVPIVASGGAGNMEDFADLFRHKGMDAGLAASIFHFGQVRIPELKRTLRENNILVRL